MNNIIITSKWNAVVITLIIVLMIASVLTSFFTVQNLEQQQLSPSINNQLATPIPCSWAILAGGLLFSAIVGGSLLLAFNRSCEMKIISSEISSNNLELAEEVKQRTIAQKELMRQRQEYRTIFDATPMMIAYTGSDGKLKRINRAGATALGSTPKEVVGKTLRELLSPDTADEFINLIKSVADTGVAARDHVGQYSFRTGNKIWAHTDVFPYEDLTGTVVGSISVIQDITSYKTAEAAVNESEQRYRSLFENNPDAVYSLDLHGNFLSVNNPTCRITGYSREELLKMSFDQIMVEEDHKTTRQHFMKSTQGETQNYQSSILSNTGKCIYLDVTNAPIIVNNEIVGVYGVARDITEQKIAHDAIAESEAKFHSLAEETPSIIGIILKTGRIAYINKKGPEMLGYSKEEIYSPEFDFTKLLDPVDTDSAIANYMRHLDGEESISAEYQLISKKGKRFTSILNTRLIKYDSDIAILGVVTDITDRKRYEEKLSQSYEALKKSLNDAVNTMAKMVELRDPYTAGHQNNVAILAKAIAVEMGLEENQIHWLQMAAKIHDIGKIYIPSDILSKPGKLSAIEFQLIKTHPKGGHDIVSSIDFPFPVALAVLQHHERLDGSGYPFGLANHEISLEARIIAVADVVEAMSSHRPYRPALGIDKALEEITINRNVLYDSDVVDACIKLFSGKRFSFGWSAV